jgi:hypothetical protein
MGDITYSTISIFFHKIKEKRSGKELYHPYEWNLLLLQTISQDKNIKVRERERERERERVKQLIWTTL